MYCMWNYPPHQGLTMLVNKQGVEFFSGKTRGEINTIAGGKSPETQERRQAHLLHNLREVMVLRHKQHQGFTLGERARLV